MKITGQRVIAAPTMAVTAVLQNGRHLVEAVPDLHLNVPLAEKQQRATINVGIGPLQGQYEATVAAAWPETAVLTLQFDGHGAKGIFHGNGSLHWQAQDDQTILHYDGDIEVTGQLANLPPRLLQANIHAIIRRCLDGIERVLWPEQFVVESQSNTALPVWLKTAVVTSSLLFFTFLLARLLKERLT